MDDANRALCYAHRNPPNGVKKTPYKVLKTLVRKQNGRRPSVSAMSQAARDFLKPKQQRGRKEGFRKTSKEQDNHILNTFKKNRPPGCGIDSREIHSKLRKTVRDEVSRRTVRRRLEEEGYTPQEKLSKNDPSKALCNRRLNFGKKYEGWTRENWKSEVQGVGDIKQFTYYPKKLYSRFKRLRASWTYMNKKERYQTPFLRPKKWFQKKDWKTTRAQKVFGLTTSNGKCFAVLIPSPWDGHVWARLVRTKLIPFLRKTFPTRRSFKILLDSEQVFHTPEAKAAYREGGVAPLLGYCWAPFRNML